MALVIILAALVLVTIILTAFMAQTTLGRQVSFSSAGQNKAETIAKTGLETILGDLRTEMVAGSTTYTSNSTNIYIPLTNTAIIPTRVAAEGFTNVVKRSAGESNAWIGNFFLSGFVNPNRAVKGASTTNLALNGRFISPGRWNAPYLLGPTLPASFVPPDWILVNRKGPLESGANIPNMAILSDRAEANLQFVVGRFAYMVYNEGGLLDANVVGFPSGVAADFTSRRSSLPQVDLNKIPGVKNADALVQWRNEKTAESPGDYTNHVLNMVTGFSKVVPGDQTFVSRQDLIRYVENNPDQITREALQYLGTSSWEVNAPSYTPKANRNRTKSGEGYRRTDPIEQDDDFNPSLVNSRVIVEFDRFSDKTRAKVGEPLIKSRFPLSRLSWIGKDGPNGASGDDIEAAFGLKYIGGVWNYTKAANGKILTLEEVAEAGREPNFFELLQAGIKVGSLGKAAGDGSSKVAEDDSNIFYQISQIVANLVDQYDSDSFPTRLQFGSGSVEISGLEDLPYLTRVYSTPARYPNPSPATYSKKVGMWYQPEVWNPNAPASSPGGNIGPSNFRFIVKGAAFVGIGGESQGQGIFLTSMPSNSFANPTGITFSTVGQQFREPAILTPVVGASVSAGSKDEFKNGASTVLIGIWIGDVESDQRWLHGGAELPDFYLASARPDSAVTFELQYKSGADWITYDRIRNVTKEMDTYVRLSQPELADYHFFLNPFQQVYFIRSDPRSDRFGVGISADGIAPGGTARPDVASGTFSWGLNAASGWTTLPYGPEQQIYPGLLTENLQTSATRYEDPDGILRPAGGAYAAGSLPSGYPMATGNYGSRPLILNRPFRSVGEMGYASRGMPWKDLDFFTQTSGDAALLDLFSVNASPPLIAGRVDLNTQQVPVIEALLSGAIKNDDANTLITDADAQTMSQSLVDFTTNTGSGKGPLENRADLVERWVGSLPAASADGIIKRQREASVRALGDIGNTRTWNLLIDIIAQSGRYLPKAQNLNQFTVDGERRYWLHVSIDRYTGKIVSRQLEPVYE